MTAHMKNGSRLGMFDDNLSSDESPVMALVNPSLIAYFITVEFVGVHTRDKRRGSVRVAALTRDTPVLVHRAKWATMHAKKISASHSRNRKDDFMKESFVLTYSSAWRLGYHYAHHDALV